MARRSIIAGIVAFSFATIASIRLGTAGSSPVPPPPGIPSDAAIDRAATSGLAYLAATQLRGGCWTGDIGHKRMDEYMIFFPAGEQEAAGTGHVGVTALAGLAFLANGCQPERGPYHEVLDRVLGYLLRSRDGYDYMTDNGTNMYSHAFALLFLAQVHGMCPRREAEVSEALRRGTRFIELSQNVHGAWRYAPYTDEADLSVTVCQVQALRAARAAGVRVNKSVIDRVVDYVRASRISYGREAGTFYYKIHGRGAKQRTTFAVNAAAVTTLHSAGLYDEKEYGRALAFIEDNYDEVSRFYPNHFYFWYGNYYAVQALRMTGGDRWKRFFGRLSQDLLARQESDGRWRNLTGPGDAFATAVACLILRVPLGYLPIFHE